MGALVGRASSRFLFVTVLPNLMLVSFVGTLLAAGAPAQAPSWHTAAHHFHALALPDVFGIAFLVLVTAVALHPIQTPMIQLLEGYWLRLPMGEALYDIAVQRHRRTWHKLRSVENNLVEDDPTSYRSASAARFALNWMPDDDVKLLPTVLGNTLRAGEERAGARYGMDTSVVMPRLVPLLDANQRDRLADGRTQLDAAARLCVVGLLSVAASLVLLLPTGDWLYLPLSMFLLAWAAYQSAVAAARTYCTQMAAAVDLYHLTLWQALSWRVPKNLLQERNKGPLLSRFLAGDDIDDDLAKTLRWQPPTAP